MKYFLILTAITLLASGPALAAEGGHSTPELPNVDWSFEGVTGHYNKGSLQRGLKVYRNVCSACHGLKRVYFRNLEALGYNEAQIKAIAAEYTITDGPNDEGEMFERAGRPSDRFPEPYPNENAAKYANNGALPPDLSLITKARAGGADYIYGLMVGYEEAPADIDLLPGQYYNEYMPGHVISMPPPLSDGMVAYEDGAAETVEQYAKDVSNFLTYAAEPELEQRKRMGIKVVLFLIAFAAVMFAVKKRVWKNIH